MNMMCVWGGGAVTRIPNINIKVINLLLLIFYVKMMSA